ncbi:carbohydrate ABC transporter permease [Cellulomonas sp. KRMCY2]|uniref:carbohydrate ABC transporter permease n=1 Tax=Cellulomonas sp. KRMCY2 TaxID=1304865 RepID=UPI0004B7D01E|nr:sugar ABC transporter permease [Cellulomonas sp. KRMCY2]
MTTINHIREGQAPPLVARRVRSSRAPYALIFPAALLVAVFLVYPVAKVVHSSFRQENVLKPFDDGFIGLANYSAILRDDLFWSSLAFSAKWVGTEVGLQLVFGLCLGLIVNEAFRGRGLARALLFSPWAVAGILTTTIWILIYNPTTGITRYLADMGIGSYGTSLLSSSSGAFWAAVLAEMWKGIPFFAIMILADLQSVPGELYEAAKVDGAGRIRRFWSITLPHIKRALLIATLLRGIWEFNNVDLLLTLTGGGPANATTTLPLYVAQTALETKEFGYGSALTMVAFLILFIVCVLYLKLTKMGDDE